MNTAHKPHALDPQQIVPFLAFLKELGVDAFFEHFAWPTASSERKIRGLEEIGFEVLSNSDRSTFLCSDDIHLELVAEHIPAHYAYAVATVDEYALVLSAVEEKGGSFSGFRHLPEQDVSESGVRASMFQHEEFGGHFQLVWRETQIYDGMFETPTNSDESSERPK